ncbi:D-alanine--D-alanine ligase A [Paenibacillus sp. BIHB 4019]|uniref:D-alanine--D-alanine ligase n=1 Tax=Paenibacillus sp. BIHB 4019 TaxID=1870819 RepID=A0A1B2DDK5_9BACL|nr:D-alanine--D-alanine ligase [Paenibacillus sp. BIHB 4019]ANY65792.1 D-alanine--D-alanine ligase A [Paenibacillus sp. BIHB 4019]
MGTKVNVALVYGGKSGEHEVSLQTAFAVLGEFDYDKYAITPFYITKQGEWRVGDKLGSKPQSASELRLAAAASGAGFPLAPLFAGLDTSGAAAAGVAAIDVVFPLLHGTFGEDGTIQGLFEMANIPYVGAGVLASAVGMDKVTMKKVFAQEGLPQCVFRYFNRTQWEKDAAFFVMECEVALGYPCFVKPANLGSSVGISKARNREELMTAIDYAFKYDRKVIVEEFVDAREIEVAVLGNDEPKASVPGEVIASNEFYDYKAKYVDGKSVMQIPAELSEEISESVRDMAIRAFLSIDGSGLSRVDFFMRRSDGQLFINEVNTLPGFTPFSMYPLMWKETGMPYRELLDKLIELALRRHGEKQKINFGASEA